MYFAPFSPNERPLLQSDVHLQTAAITAKKLLKTTKITLYRLSFSRPSVCNVHAVSPFGMGLERASSGV